MEGKRNKTKYSTHKYNGTEVQDDRNSHSLRYMLPPTSNLADLVNYVPQLLSNLIISYETIESCFQDKLVQIFHKCLVEGNFRRVVEGLPVPGASEWPDNELDTFEESLKRQFKFSNNLNPYDNLMSIIEDSDYKGDFYITKKKKILFIPEIRKKKKGFVDPVIGHDDDICPGVSRELFAQSLDGFHFVWFLNRLQAFVGKETHSQIISLHHLKSIALFTCLIDIPVTFISFLFEETTDCFLRSLAVYLQYFLQLWDVCLVRTEIRKNKLNYSKSSNIERKWQTNLNDMRFFIARNYIVMIIGAKNMQNYHHVNGKLSIHCNDMVHYELLYKFSAQIMLMIFNHENNMRIRQIIVDEIDKLFRVQESGARDPYDIFSPNDRSILEGKFDLTQKLQGIWGTRCLAEIKRPGRDKKVLYVGTNSIIVTKSKRIRVFQSALLVAEDRLEVANIKIGILGKPRTDYPPLLNCSQITPFERNEGLVKVEGVEFRPENLFGYGELKYDKPVMVTKEFPDRPYNTDYSLLIRKKQPVTRTVRMWEKYALASDRFWYYIDPHCTAVDCIKQKFLELFEEEVRKKAEFERRIKTLLTKIKR